MAEFRPVNGIVCSGRTSKFAPWRPFELVRLVSAKLPFGMLHKLALTNHCMADMGDRILF